MKSRGVLFSAAMVRALLKGRKTQTRRPVTLPKGYELDGHVAAGVEFVAGDERHIDDRPLVLCSRPNGSTGERRVTCPYGEPGDQLWVRETWGYEPASLDSERRVVYRATLENPPGWPCYRGAYEEMVRWRPSLLMPRWASRITLEVERVRLEHVQDISVADVYAEGVDDVLYKRAATGHWQGRCASPQQVFGQLWDSIHSRKSAIRGRKPSHTWADNPLVWAITFRVVPESQEHPTLSKHEETWP